MHNLLICLESASSIRQTLNLTAMFIAIELIFDEKRPFLWKAAQFLIACRNFHLITEEREESGCIQLFVITNNHTSYVYKTSHLQNTFKTLINPYNSINEMETRGRIWGMQNLITNIKIWHTANTPPTGAVNTFHAISSPFEKTSMRT